MFFLVNIILAQKILRQIYFLRQQMSKDGYVPLSLIASFNRVQTLCDNINFIAEVYFIKILSFWGKGICYF